MVGKCSRPGRRSILAFDDGTGPAWNDETSVRISGKGLVNEGAEKLAGIEGTRTGYVVGNARGVFDAVDDGSLP